MEKIDKQRGSRHQYIFSSENQMIEYRFIPSGQAHPTKMVRSLHDGLGGRAEKRKHAASKGLSYPLKSSIVRRCLSIGSKAGPTTTLGLIIFCEGICLMEEIKCLNEQ